jgi:hypothetical protein
VQQGSLRTITGHLQLRRWQCLLVTLIDCSHQLSVTLAAHLQVMCGAHSEGEMLCSPTPEQMLVSKE